jgi:hypothetical protein
MFVNKISILVSILVTRSGDDYLQLNGYTSQVGLRTQWLQWWPGTGLIVNSKLHYDRQSVGQSVLVSGNHLGPATNFSLLLFLYWQLRVSWCGASSLTRGWACNLPLQLLLGELAYSIYTESIRETCSPLVQSQTNDLWNTNLNTCRYDNLLGASFSEPHYATHLRLIFTLSSHLRFGFPDSSFLSFIVCLHLRATLLALLTLRTNLFVNLLVVRLSPSAVTSRPNAISCCYSGHTPKHGAKCPREYQERSALTSTAIKLNEPSTSSGSRKPRLRP